MPPERLSLGHLFITQHIALVLQFSHAVYLVLAGHKSGGKRSRQVRPVSLPSSASVPAKFGQCSCQVRPAFPPSSASVPAKFGQCPCQVRPVLRTQPADIIIPSSKTAISGIAQPTRRAPRPEASSTLG
ncbi:hypothetical protein BV898_11994 [Hypsibius exemplaris]|uniref:Uncharacterized protein n=1 Tax=Hypsibius exemplaris TaxID=2072580 RepID=A0A1W0WEZ4_HYPEX|nr:hypothetical protein BV898_11994 [Hypsibius exemplaris]